jgi:dUTP pyrophosphatase
VIDVVLLRLDPDLPAPSYAQPGDAGADLRSAIDVRLEPGERAMVPTGIALALPDGHAAFVHPRSGLAIKHGLSMVNTPGTIDAGYRGEIKVCLINHDPREEIVLRRGDRIAQLVVQKVEYARFVEVSELPASDRGPGGHGSTGGHDRLAGGDGP